jgi:hypothetical protein
MKVTGGKARRKETTRKTKTYGLTILRWIFGRWRGVDWNGLAQDREQCCDFVNALINLRHP